MSLEKNLQLLSEVVNVLELFHYEQKDGIIKHESRLREIIDRIELISRLTNGLANDVNDIKPVKTYTNKRVSCALLLPVEYFMHAIEETVDTVLIVGHQCNEQLFHYTMTKLNKCSHRLDSIIFGGIVGIDITGEEVILTYLLTYSHIH